MLNSSRHSRGVADTIGYILIVGIIFASITAVYYVGFDILNDSRDIEEDANIERSLSVFISNEDEVVQGQAPSRSTEVRLGDNEVSTNPSTSRMYVNIPGEASYSGGSASLTYSSPLGKYYYEMGAIIRSNEEGNVMRVTEKPKLIKYIPETDSIHIQILSSTTGSRTVSGGIREIVMTRIQNDIYTHELSSKERVEIYIRTPRTLIWKEYYENQPSIEECEPYSGNEIVCYTKPVDEVSIQKTSLRIEIF